MSKAKHTPGPWKLLKNDTKEGYPTGAFTDMPVIIDGPGRYITRKGQTAYVDRIRIENSSPVIPPATFAATGHIEHKTTRSTRSEFTTWHVSGRNTAKGLHSSDIVRKD